MVGLKSEGGLAYLTAEEMAEVDRTAIEDYGIDVVVLMENAGGASAALAMRMLGGEVAGKTICCLVGKGNNGGDGMVAARHLSNWGATVQVILAEERSALRDVPARQAAVLEKMGIPIKGPGEDFSKAHLVIDALLGYGARGNPKEPIASLIRLANISKRPMLAVDIPSGMDATTGEARNPCVRATATVTFGFPKTGFLSIESKGLTGDLYLADISLPSKLYSAYAFPAGIFEKESLVKIR